MGKAANVTRRAASPRRLHPMQGHRGFNVLYQIASNTGGSGSVGAATVGLVLSGTITEKTAHGAPMQRHVNLTVRPEATTYAVSTTPYASGDVPDQDVVASVNNFLAGNGPTPPPPPPKPYPSLDTGAKQSWVTQYGSSASEIYYVFHTLANRANPASAVLADNEGNVLVFLPLSEI